MPLYIIKYNIFSILNLNIFNKFYMKFLVVGCGLSGIVISRLLTNSGHYCYIIDERNHIGGNCFTLRYNKDTDIHVYGPHIFHTPNKEVWDFVNKYDEFLPFQLNVKANYKGKIYSLPFNMNTFHELFNINLPSEAYRIIEKDIELYDNPKNLEEQAISQVGKTIYNTLIKEYTEKQWNKPCTELSPDIIKRLPIRLSWNNNYFNDTYQGIPKHGYTTWLLNILNGLDNEDPIEYELNKKFNISDEYINEFNFIIYTGQIDRLLDYRLGELEWRSLRFDHQTVLNTIENDQGCPIMNYTSHNEKYTRSIDHYYFNHKINEYSNETKIITYEYPQDYGKDKIAYYPINNDKNNILYNEYVKILNKEYPNIILLGRLGLYKYFDMDDTIEKCFELYNEKWKP